jgi:hypothetical protein
METEPNLVFVALDTDTVEEVCADSFVIDTDTAELSPDEVETLGVADQLGTFGDAAAAIVRRVGVPVADLWAAYQWRQNLRSAGVLDDVEKYVMAVLS